MTPKQCPGCKDWTTDTNCDKCDMPVREESTAEKIAKQERDGYISDGSDAWMRM